ncbi:MAG: hypothetical protein R3Y28_02945 [Candidatus Gastranaerophilales bacterium]
MLKKFYTFVIILGFIISGSCIEARVIHNRHVPKRNQYRTYNNPIQVSQNYKYPRVTDLEKKILGRCYENNDINTRLSRLEKHEFKRTCPTLSYDERIDNLIKSYERHLNSNINLKNLSKIEAKIIGRNYANESLENRLTRIETKMFGAGQSGDIKDRFKLIENAYGDYQKIIAQNSESQAFQDDYDTCYQNQQYYSTNNTNGNWLSNMNNKFFGSPTGYTPQLDYYDFPSNGGTQSTDYQTNNGYYYNHSNMGSGMGVTILD